MEDNLRTLKAHHWLPCVTIGSNYSVSGDNKELEVWGIVWGRSILPIMDREYSHNFEGHYWLQLPNNHSVGDKTKTLCHIFEVLSPLLFDNGLRTVKVHHWVALAYQWLPPATTYLVGDNR